MAKGSVTGVGIIASLLCAYISGCTPYAEVRLVKRTKAGGEYAVLGARDLAMQKAYSAMAQDCGGPQAYEVVEEGEAVVGQDAVSSGTKKKEKGVFGAFTSEETSTSSRNATEWRVKYQCKGAEPEPAEAPAADAPADEAPAEGGQPQGRIREIRIRF